MDKVEFDAFLERHGVKDDFYEDAERLYEKSSVDKDDKVAEALQSGMSPFIWCIPDWGDCSMDWNHYDDLFDYEFRGSGVKAPVHEEMKTYKDEK